MIPIKDNYPFWFYYPIDKTLLGATTPGQSWSGSDCSKGVPHIPLKFQHYWSLIISLVSYPGDLSTELYPAAEIQSVYSTALEIRKVILFARI